MLIALSRRALVLALATTVTLAVLAGATVAVLRYAVFPQADAFRPRVEALLTRAIGQDVRIGRLEADWRGLRPRFRVTELVLSREGAQDLILPQVEAVLSWWQLLRGEVRLRHLAVERPALTLRRLRDGRFRVAGVVFDPHGRPGGFSDWLLAQGNVEVRDAQLTWLDERRGAPPLVLSGVQFQLVNRAGRHRFALRATPPTQQGSELDLRGAVRRGRDGWGGKFYLAAALPSAQRWRPWLDLPTQLVDGGGRLRAWFDLRAGRPTGLSADLRLARLRLRLAPKLSPLDVTDATVHLSVRSPAGQSKAKGAATVFTIERAGAQLPNGQAVAGLEIRVRSHGPTRHVSLRLPILSLSALGPVAPALPGGVRELAGRAPAGELRDLELAAVQDAGSWRLRSLRTGFDGLALRLPKFTANGLSGHGAWDDGAGRLTLASGRSSLAFAGVFTAPLAFDRLDGELSWRRQDDAILFTLNRLAAANADFAGVAHGHYRWRPGTRGRVDLRARLHRAKVAAVPRYLPAVVPEKVRGWLARALLAGHSHDTRLVLRGDLARFPFADPRHGRFEVTARVEDGVLAYADGWPRVEALGARLAFRGRGMHIERAAGRISGARIEGARAVIDNLGGRDAQLVIEGRASGASSNFLEFLREGPLREHAGPTLGGLQAAGDGRLALRLDIPLRAASKTQLTGEYLFSGNRLAHPARRLSAEDLDGRLNFTRGTLDIQAVGRFLGGHTTLSAQRRPDGDATVRLRGRAQAEALRALWPSPWLRRVRGAADWSADLNTGQSPMWQLRSDLKGLRSDLPAPLAKTADTTLPLRLDARTTGGGVASPLSVEVRLGDRLQAGLRWRRGKLESGAVAVGGKTDGAGRQDGVWLTGKLPFLDLDAWRRQVGGEAGGGGGALAGGRLEVARARLFGRDWHDLDATVWLQPQGTVAQVAAREIEGVMRVGPRRIEAHLARLDLAAVKGAPADTHGRGAKNAAPAAELLPNSGPLPALDLRVDRLHTGERELGGLKLEARPQGRNLLIETLTLTSADGTLSAHGVWRRGASTSTELDFALDLSDAGGFLRRMGYGEALRGGSADLEGRLRWPGGPGALKPARLSGELSLRAEHGRFERIKPGPGRLLGILSLQALPRRVKLDFRDVFSQGFAFDQVSGHLRLRSGVLTSDDFTMLSPAAAVRISGETDLGRETQNLRVKVTPSLEGGVSLATALLGGPVAGLTALVVQKALNDPLSRLVTHEYVVTGTWDETNVEKSRAAD